jgi:hypothetical protein
MRQCYKIRNLFGSYLYNSISPEERAEVDNHIKTCQKCADDLHSQRKTLDKISIFTRVDDSQQIDQDRFMWNVYKRIASETVKRRSRSVFITRYVLQPAVATLIVVSVITIGVLRFNPNDDNLSPEISITSVDLPHFVKREAPQNNLFKGSEVQLSKKKTTVVTTKTFSLRRVTEEQTDVKNSTPITEHEKPDVLVSKEMSSNSRNLLISADIINYSLKDPRKALSRYDMIVNYYPNTDAAQEAKERIKSILDSEFSSQSESSNVEDTANAGI